MSKFNKNRFTGSSSKTGRVILSAGYSDLPEDPINMSDEELYYIASVISELTSKNLQRSVFESLHINCDEGTIVRFHEFFRDDEVRKIMISC